MLTKTPIMWTGALALDAPVMDSIHQEFVTLLAGAQQAPDETLADAWQALIVHTEAHFGQENAWMLATGFASGNCHTVQHEVVLRVMRDALVRGREGDLAILRRLADELADWFYSHAQSMDAALALHLRSAGVDLLTGELPRAVPVPAQPIQGCGGKACSPKESQGPVDQDQAAASQGMPA